MSASQDSVDIDKLGQATYTGQLAVVVDALTTNKQLAHVADTVGSGVYLDKMSSLYLHFVTLHSKYSVLVKA